MIAKAWQAQQSIMTKMIYKRALCTNNPRAKKTTELSINSSKFSTYHWNKTWTFQFQYQLETRPPKSVCFAKQIRDIERIYRKWQTKMLPFIIQQRAEFESANKTKTRKMLTNYIHITPQGTSRSRLSPLSWFTISLSFYQYSSTAAILPILPAPITRILQTDLSSKGTLQPVLMTALNSRIDQSGLWQYSTICL